MKERELKFNISEDQNLVVFDEKTLKDYTKANNDLYFVVAELANNIKENKLTVSYQETLVSLIESHCCTLTKVLGYEGVLARQKEERYSEIRELNIQNRDLRKQLGEKASPEDIRESLKNYTEIFEKWWNIYGFGHTSEIKFEGYGFSAKLSGMMTGAYYDKESDSSEEDKYKYLTDLGFDIIDKESRSDKKILHNDNNVILLERLIKERFPSAFIQNIKSYSGRKAKEFEFREIYIRIPDFTDFIKE